MTLAALAIASWCMGAHVQKPAEARRIASPEALNRWQSHYYLHPQPAAVPDALEELSKMGALSKGDLGVAAFFGFLCAANPSSVPSWIAAARKLGDPASSLMGQAIWFSRLGNRDALLDTLSKGGSKQLVEYVEGLKRDQAPDPVEVELNSPELLDVQWAGFTATGNARFAQRVISALTASDPMVSGPAKWSLTSMAAQNPRVQATCEAALANSKDELHAVIQDVIDQAKKDPKRVTDESKL